MQKESTGKLLEFISLLRFLSYKIKREQCCISILPIVRKQNNNDSSNLHCAYARYHFKFFKYIAHLMSKPYQLRIVKHST